MVEIKFEKEKNRSVAISDGKVIGECDFIINEDNINIIHTVVSSDFQGQGIARKLVECVLGNIKEYNKDIIADCSYARKIIESK